MLLNSEDYDISMLQTEINTSILYNVINAKWSDLSEK